MKNKLRKLLLSLGALALAFGGVFAVAGPASATTSTITCGSYGATPSFNCDSFSGFSGQQPWGYPVDANGHNCTNYVTYRLWQAGVANPGNLHNAYEWDNYATSYGITVNTTPTVGAVAQWEINSPPATSTGHVAFVDAVYSDGSISTSEDNYGGTTMTRHLYPGSSWPDHFIHFSNSSSTSGPALGLMGVKAPLDDFVIYRQSGGTGYWYAMQNQNGAGNGLIVNGWTHGGQAGDIALTADFTGDKIDDFVIYRQGTWYVEDGVTHAPTAIWGAVFGQPGDIPVVGDVNGDGYADFGVYRVSGGVGTWYILSGTNGQPTAMYGVQHGGWAGDVPLIGDFNGDGYGDLVIYRVVSGVGTWYALNSTNGQQIPWAWGTQYGTTGDIPVTGDFNGDGYADFGVYRNIGGTGYWYAISGVNTGTVLVNGVAHGGWTGDVPLAGNFG